MIQKPICHRKKRDICENWKGYTKLTHSGKTTFSNSHYTATAWPDPLPLCLRRLLILKDLNDVYLLIGLLLSHHRLSFPKWGGGEQNKQTDNFPELDKRYIYTNGKPTLYLLRWETHLVTQHRKLHQDKPHFLCARLFLWFWSVTHICLSLCVTNTVTSCVVIRL
jgi:hypothetical protein